LREKGTNFGRWIIEEDLQILDSEVRDPNVADLASADQFLHLLPCLDKVPIWKVLLQVVGVGR
jgi:hypothetical protein